MPLGNPEAYTYPATGNIPLQPQVQSPDPTNPLVALRGTVVNPMDSARTTTAAGQADQLATSVAQGSAQLPGFQSVAPGTDSAAATRVAAGGASLPSFTSIPAGSPLISSYGGPSSNVQSLEQLLTQQAQGLTQLPDRAQLANQAFDLFAQSGDDAFNRSLERAVALNAAAGRTGSGLVTRDLADITSARSEDLANARAQLGLQAAAQSLQDRLGSISALSGIQGQLSGQDLARMAQRLGIEGAQANEAAGLRGEARGERNALVEDALRRFGLDTEALALERGFRDEARQERSAALGDAFSRAGFDLETLGALTGREGFLRTADQGARDETRFERSRADQLATEANQARIAQQQAELQAQSQLWNQLMDRLGLSGQFGFGGPSPVPGAQLFTNEAGAQGTENLNTGRQALQNAFLSLLNNQGAIGAGVNQYGDGLTSAGVPILDDPTRREL